MSRSVYVVAVAARTCVGLTAEATAAAVRAGVSRIMEHPDLNDASGEPLHCGRDPQLDPVASGPARLFALGSRTLLQLTERIARTHRCEAEIKLHLALPESRPGWLASDASELMARLSEVRDERLGGLEVVCSGEGHAGALQALQSAVQQVASGQSELALAGGIDSYLHPETVRWLEQHRRLARAGIRAGFPPGEGAAMLAIASRPELRRLAAPALARVRAVVCAHEPRSLDGDEALLGEGLSKAVAEVTADLTPAERVTDLYGDLNGERHRTEDWGFTVLRSSHVLRDGSDTTSAVSSCGDVGAATGALACALAVHAWQRGYAKGDRALVWAGSWQGLRGAAVLEQEG